MDELKRLIRDVPDFPKPGIVFKDITPLLAEPKAMQRLVAACAQAHAGRGITKVVAIESRGFLFGVPVALAMGVGFVPARKPGKLPWKAVREAYGLEYGKDAIEMHEDSVGAQDTVLIVDDVLATGGTAGAAVNLIQKIGGHIVELGFLIELKFLNGREKLQGLPVRSLVVY